MLRTYYEALAGFRRLAAICVLLLFFSGIAEAFGIAALLPLLRPSSTPAPAGRRRTSGSRATR